MGQCVYNLEAKRDDNDDLFYLLPSLCHPLAHRFGPSIFFHDDSLVVDIAFSLLSFFFKGHPVSLYGDDMEEMVERKTPFDGVA